MAISKTEHGSLSDVTLRAGPHRGALVAILAVPATVLAWLIPLPPLLPVLSVVSFVIAVTTALFAYHLKIDRRAPGITLWDIAGGFTFIWIAAGLMGEPKHLIEWFDRVAMIP